MHNLSSPNARSETSFHIFIAMASRRIEADRFFTSDFTPQVIFFFYYFKLWVEIL